MTPDHVSEWRSEARDAGTKTAQPSPAPGARAGGFPALGGGGRGVGAGRTALGVLRPYNPISWFHPVGIHRVLARLKPRLPDVGGCLFLTFTINPHLFADPSLAFEYARQHLRRVFFQLRRGVAWKGKTHQIDAPYCIKVEFHGNEWAHFHAIFRTRRFLPAGLLNELWDLGRTNVRRITNERFHYLLKYVTKGGGDLPEWVRHRGRLRVFQASRGFLKPCEKSNPATASTEVRRRRKSSDTLGERVARYERTALLQSGEQFSQVPLCAPFRELHAHQILPAAVDGRYLGAGQYQINDLENLVPWLSQSNPPK